MESKSIVLIGNFDSRTHALGGQIIKTINTKTVLTDSTELRTSTIRCIHLEELRVNPIKFFFSLRFLFRRKLSVIFMPSINGFKLLLPVTLCLSKLFSNKLIYIVIGGWLPKLTQRNLFYRFLVKRIDCVLVESNSMLQDLATLGIRNTKIFPNFRFDKLSLLPNLSNLLLIPSKFQVLFIARVTKLKGVDLLFEFENYLAKEQLSLQGLSINIAGPIDPNYKQEFIAQLNRSKLCHYIGIVPHDKVYEIINGNDVVVLPSRYPGEGMPGTIVDSYMASVPVIVSNWRYLPEFVDHNVTGFVFDLNSPSDFYSKIVSLYYDREKLNELKQNASRKRLEFIDKSALALLIKIL